ncbi:hypothetical protein BDF19DRAFT_413014 [Syncephalis fuscata]|nr:hypothetical protein BDF19DRAFT_413014 [Syncephalis fuscata]
MSRLCFCLVVLLIYLCSMVMAPRSDYYIWTQAYYKHWVGQTIALRTTWNDEAKVVKIILHISSVACHIDTGLLLPYCTYTVHWRASRLDMDYRLYVSIGQSSNRRE